MAIFVHLAPQSLIRLIRRNGIAPTRFKGMPKDATLRRGVFAVPVSQDFMLSHQWLRELRRGTSEPLCAVYFRIDDNEIVHWGRYRQPHVEVTAVQAVAEMCAGARDGWEAIIPRRIEPNEILRVKALPQVIGWRYYPGANGKRPLWPFPGSYGAKRLREGITRYYEGGF